MTTIKDTANAEQPERRPLEAINADIDAIDNQISELGRVKASLQVEHAEAAESLGLVPKII